MSARSRSQGQRLLIVAITGCTLLANWMGSATAKADEAKKLAMVLQQAVGTWDVKINAGGEIYAAKISFKQDADQVQGRIELDGNKSRVQEMFLKDGNFFFTTQTQRFSRPVKAVFACTIADDAMRGEVDFVSGTSSSSYDFSGQRKGGSGSMASDAQTDLNSTAAPGKPSSDKAVRRLTFRQGVDGYEQMVDTEIWQIAPTKTLHMQGTMTTDGNNGGGESQVLMRFEDILGEGSRRIPRKCRVVKATLTVIAFDPGTTCFVHRMQAPWTAAATWNGMVEGVAIDNIEASSVRDGFTFGQITMDKQSVEFDVTSTVQRWVDGEKNLGWVFVNTGSNGWDFYSSNWIEVGLRPQLEVEFEERTYLVTQKEAIDASISNQ